MEKFNVADAEDCDVNARLHGNWTIDNAKGRLHQFMQMNKIHADYVYSHVGPDHSKYSEAYKKLCVQNYDLFFIFDLMGESRIAILIVSLLAYPVIPIELWEMHLSIFKFYHTWLIQLKVLKKDKNGPSCRIFACGSFVNLSKRDEIIGFSMKSINYE